MAARLAGWLARRCRALVFVGVNVCGFFVGHVGDILHPF